MSGHIFILGGARSGKTGFGESMAMRAGNRPAYLATAEALDEEMKARVRRHQHQRQGRFETIEEPLDLAGALNHAADAHDVVLVDCLTLWMSNLLGAGRDVAKAVDELVAVLGNITTCKIILISNEVGLGIVPENALARSFRDLAGAAHQNVAAACDEVYFVAAGLPFTLKGGIPRAD